MKRVVASALFLALGGCASGNTSQPCAAISDEVLAEIYGSKVKAKEVAGVRSDSDEREGSCDIDFEDGQWLSFTLSDSTKPVTPETQATYGTSNSALTQKFGYSVIHEPGSKELTAFKTPTKKVYLRTGMNPGGGYEDSFPANVDEKLTKVLEKLGF